MGRRIRVQTETGGRAGSAAVSRTRALSAAGAVGRESRRAGTEVDGHDGAGGGTVFGGGVCLGEVEPLEQVSLFDKRQQEQRPRQLLALGIAARLAVAGPRREHLVRRVIGQQSHAQLAQVTGALSAPGAFARRDEAMSFTDYLKVVGEPDWARLQEKYGGG